MCSFLYFIYLKFCWKTVALDILGYKYETACIWLQNTDRWRARH